MEEERARNDDSLRSGAPPHARRGLRGARADARSGLPRSTPAAPPAPARPAEHGPAARALARAESRLGEGEYDLVFNNCEHFANWCRTGRSYSDQSDRMLAPVLDTSVFAALSPQALLSFATEG